MNAIVEMRQGVCFFAALMRFIEAQVVIDDVISRALRREQLSSVFTAKIDSAILASFSLECGCTAFAPGNKLLAFTVYSACYSRNSCAAVVGVVLRDVTQIIVMLQTLRYCISFNGNEL